MAKKNAPPQASPSETSTVSVTPETPVSGSNVPQPENPVEVPTNNTENKTVQSVSSIEELARGASENSPEPNETAINHEAQKKQEEEKAGRGSGQEGKKRGPYNKINSPRSEVRTKTTETDKAEKDKRCYASGAETIEALIVMTSGLLGPEWYWQEPRTIAMPNGQKIVYSERERGRDVFGNLYVYYQWEKPSPLMAVAFFTIGYVGTRLRNPDVKAKALGAFGKLKLWLHRKKLENAVVKTETKIDGVKTQEAK